MRLLLPALLLLALLVASAAGHGQVLAAHGQGELLRLCGPASGSEALWLSGMPQAIWLIPAQAGLLVLALGARRSSSRAEAAAGVAWGLGALLLLGALLAPLREPALWTCGPGIALIVLQAGVMAVIVASGRPRLRAPAVEDWLVALLVGLTVLMGAGFGARILDHRLTGEEERALAEPSLDLPAGTSASLRLVAAEPIQPGPLRSPVPIDDQDAGLGPMRAAVTAVAFLDFQDPASRRMAWTLMELEPFFSDRVRFLVKHLPMEAECNARRRRTLHPGSCRVAIALQCAHDQRAFRGYRLALLRDPERLDAASLRRRAERLGLDLAAFDACLASPEARKAVEADVSQAGKGGLVDPPLLFVEGRVLGAEATMAEIEATLSLALGERAMEPDGSLAARVVGAEAPLPPPGPRPMVAIGGGRPAFIDAVELSLDAEGRGRPEGGAQPWPLSLGEARQACRAAGKRLCTREEWLTACQGRAPVDEDGSGSWGDDLTEGRLRPYGDPHRAGWCATDGRVEATGTHGLCRGPEEVDDLVGNMAEWVDEGLLLGGSARDGEEASCQRAERPLGEGFRSAWTGARCCADAPPEEGPGASVPPPVLPAERLDEGSRAALALAPGRTTLIVPWTLDCAPCQALLGEAAAQAAARGLRVKALSVEGRTEEARAWMRSSGLAVEWVEDPRAEIFGRLGDGDLPVLIAVDGQGRVLGRGVALDELPVDMRPEGP